MYVEKTFNEFKNKIKISFELENDINCLYYESYFERRKISVKTEEDYEIMINSNMINYHQKILYVYF